MLGGDAGIGTEESGGTCRSPETVALGAARIEGGGRSGGGGGGEAGFIRVGEKTYRQILSFFREREFVPY